ncbi:DUF333 domain-containing protein [Brucella oryzae]|uniref:DUF333 domain-containing protein n=1 Tax=Brucella oryzae TaxID=335286 RepID=UPI001B83F488|nr:DUF333 domain-containing protein [Brucella oryzae]MBR7653377.1 DUF333 domain-containing protein [Brucella oryzae]
MKKIIASILFVAAGAGSAVAAPNPASAFCEKMGGESQIVTKQDGSEIGLCVFKNGTTIEEWTLFRMFNGDS